MSRGGKRTGAGRKSLGDKRKQTLSVRLPPETIRRLEEACRVSGLSRAELLDDILQQHPLIK